MGRFNKKEFGERLKIARKSKGYSLVNVANDVGKDPTTIGRYESGEIMPDAEMISLLCDALEISEYDLFKKDKITNKENSLNPFGVKELYIYYSAYSQEKDSYLRGKFIFNLYEKDGICKVDMLGYKSKEIYMSGYVLADNNIAVFVLENYKGDSTRLEVTEIILNIARGMENSMMGSLHCTDKYYRPAVRKCIISKKDVEFSDEMWEKLRITDREKMDMSEKNIWYVDVASRYDFEI